MLVVNVNGNPFVSDCIKSIISTDYGNFHLLFYDSGSTDGSDLVVREICRSKENVLLLRSPRTSPITQVTNLAISIAGRDADYIAILDNDVIVHPDWLRKLTEAMQSDSNIGSCQSLLLRIEPPDTIDGTGDFIDTLGYAVSRHSGLKLGQVDLSKVGTDIFSARSAAMIVRRDLFDRLRGLDESFGFVFEDVDLGWRIRLAGLSTRLVADSLVLHKAGSTSGRLSKSYIRYIGTRNRLQMLLKNYDTVSLLTYIPVRLALDILVCVLLFLVGRRKSSIAILRGLWWNLINSSEIAKRRAFVQSRVRKVRDSDLIGRLIIRNLILHPSVGWRLLTAKED